jgi:guanylate kinase
MTPEDFERKREAGGFLEANLVHGHWYGTPRDQVRAALADGQCGPP